VRLYEGWYMSGGQVVVGSNPATPTNKVPNIRKVAKPYKKTTYKVVFLYLAFQSISLSDDGEDK
jgi:hypothetical protein